MIRKISLLVLAASAVLLSCAKSEPYTEPVEEVVDMKLSVKWRSWNLGATRPDEYGDVYAWAADTVGTYYDWATYKWYNNSDGTLKKYNTDSFYGPVDWKLYIEEKDDIAHKLLGGKWRMPTDYEWEELRTECVWSLTDKNGIYGYEVVSRKNGKSIFLPFVGAYHNDEALHPVGAYGFYWSSTLKDDAPLYAWCQYFTRGDIKRYYDYRCYGLSVRPVLDE